MNVQGWTLRRLAGVAMLTYGALAILASAQVMLSVDWEGLAVAGAILGFFGVIYGVAFAILGLLVLRNWLGRAPLATGALLSAAVALSYLTVPSLIPFAISVAVTAVTVGAIVNK